MESEYLPRLVDRQLKNALQQASVVVLEGPNGCGKATTAARAARSYLRLRHPWHRSGKDSQVGNFASLMDGEAPRLFSECQNVSGLTEAASIASENKEGQFLFTASVAENTDYPGVRRLRMRPLSLFESGLSSGDVSLESLFDGDWDGTGSAAFNASQAAAFMTHGGWPSAAGLAEDAAIEHVGVQMGTLAGVHLGHLAGFRPEEGIAGALLRSLAQHSLTTATITDITETASAEAGRPLAEAVMKRGMDLLTRIYLLEDIPAWHPPLKTGSVIQAAPKHLFVDPSVVSAILGFTPDDLVKDVQWFSRLFKSLCVRDLRTYAEMLDGEVLHYRDTSRLKTDAVVMLPDGRWGAVEMELDVLGNDPAASRLLKLHDKVDQEMVGPPSFLMILTLTGDAYRRRDGVFVVPIAALRS